MTAQNYPADSEANTSPEHSASPQGGELPQARTEAGVARSIEMGATGNPAPPPPAGPPPAASRQQAGQPMQQPLQQPVGMMRGNPSVADDADLIEKEWVIRAKQIVEHTRTDPRKQSEAMNLMKADYLKKRYNRTIKLTKD